MMTDPIADMLTRIRNAGASRKHDVLVPMSKVKYEIAKILKEEGWVYDIEIVKKDDLEKNTSGLFDQIKIVLKYKKSGKPAINSIQRSSKPGLRVYVKKGELPRVLNNLGIAIISTPKGMMTNKKARKEQIGGEVICELY